MYICNQCLSPLKIMNSYPIRVEVYSIQHYVIAIFSDLRQFFVLSLDSPVSFTTKADIQPRYGWNTIEITITTKSEICADFGYSVSSCMYIKLNLTNVSIWTIQFNCRTNMTIMLKWKYHQFMHGPYLLWKHTLYCISGFRKGHWMKVILDSHYIDEWNKCASTIVCITCRYLCAW